MQNLTARLTVTLPEGSNYGRQQEVEASLLEMIQKDWGLIGHSTPGIDIVWESGTDFHAHLAYSRFQGGKLGGINPIEVGPLCDYISKSLGKMAQVGINPLVTSAQFD